MYLLYTTHLIIIDFNTTSDFVVKLHWKERKEKELEVKKCGGGARVEEKINSLNSKHIGAL